MRDKKAGQIKLKSCRCRTSFLLRAEVEYAVIPTELDETADVHGDDLSDTAQQCRFRRGLRRL